MKVLSRCAPLWVVLLLLAVSIVTAVYALAITRSVIRLGLWEGVVESPHFTVTQLYIDVRGRNRVEVFVAVKNTDTAIHKAIVCIQLLNADGDAVLEDCADTGSVEPGEEWLHKYVFVERSIVEEFTAVLIVVREVE